MKLPDGPKLPALLQTLSIIADPTQFLERCAQRYGDRFTLRVLGYNSPPVVFFSNPESIQAIFTTLSDKFELGKITHVFRPLTGSESLIMQDGARHQQQRQLLMPAMHGDRLYRCGQLICDLTVEMTANWAIGSSLNLQAAMLDLSLEVILRVVFGIQPGQRYEQLKTRLHELMEAINSPLNSVQFFLPPLQQDLGAWSPWGKFLRLRQQIDDLLYAEIDDRRAQSEPIDRSDILSLLITARDQSGEPLSNVELRDQLMTLLLLGHETTASGLAWAFYWLYQQPQMLNKLLAELDALPTQPDPIALAQQPYLTAVCKEALRVYPIALISQPRRVKEPIQIAGYEFNPGAILVPCVYLAHRRADAYPNPTQFQPDRFLNGKLSPYEYLPFGGGSRSCIGMSLALFEMKLVLATVLMHRRLSMAAQLRQSVHPVRRGITFVPPQVRLTVGQPRDRSPVAAAQ
jgi:hypothetical protein